MFKYHPLPKSAGRRTEMTFLNPSSTSLSFRLSRSFFICAAGGVFVELRELLAVWAASRVRSRAMGISALCCQNKRRFDGKSRDIPLSSTLDILDIDSMGDHKVSKRVVMANRNDGGAKRLHLERFAIQTSHHHATKFFEMKTTETSAVHETVYHFQSSYHSFN